MEGLTWLHLSDWHQGNKEFNREVVGEALIEDLERRTTTIDPNLAKVDFIVFSGDVAHSGKPEEYQAAKVEFFDRLLVATGLDTDRLFIVPGNHDLNIDEFNFLPGDLQKPLESDREVQKWIVDEIPRELVLKPFKAFTKFVTDYTKQENPDYASFRILPIDGKKIALLGLNSAWICGRHKDPSGKIDDEGYLLIGEPQIHQRLKDIRNSDIKIAIFHHPFEWLTRFDRRHIEGRLINECDFILNGHEHTPNARLISNNHGFFGRISTGASYADRIPNDPLFINAYNIVHLDFEKKQGVVFLRRWSDRQNKWIEDTDTYHPGGKLPINQITILHETSPGISVDDTRVDRGLDQHPSIQSAERMHVAEDVRLKESRYSSIQALVDAAKAGDTIKVAEGTYFGNVHIDKSLTIIGAGKGKTIFEGNQAGSVFTIGKNYANIDANLSGMTIKGGIGTSVLRSTHPSVAFSSQNQTSHSWSAA
jgi:predicted phosphodiesterase